MTRLAVPAIFLALLPAFVPTPARAQVPTYCFPAATHLCLNGDRFQVDVDWMYPGAAGKGQAVPLTADTGLFWFFGNSNLELIVKVLDGRPVNGHFWVYYGGLSDVEYRITVTDTQTGAREIYTNPHGQLASGSDTSAFDAEPPSAPGPVRPGGTGEAAPLLRLGEEFRANVTTRGLQGDPAVATGPDGTTMVVWGGPPAPGESTGNEADVYGRFYDRAGSPRGGELRLSAATAGYHGGARVAASSTGKFMVVWNDRDRVAARVYGADGQPLGGEIQVGAAAGLQGQPAIAGDPAGGFLVGWPVSGGTLRLQRFNAQGNMVGNEISLLRSVSGLGLAASPVPQGGFLISWIESAGSLETNVRALRLDTSAQPLGSVALTPNVDAVRHPGYQPGAAVPLFHADGGFSVLWTNHIYNGQAGANGLFARRYTASGEPAGNVIPLRQQGAIGDLAPAAVTLPSGATMALWHEYSRTEDLDGGTFARLYDPSWQPIGGELRVNTYTQAEQGGAAVAADAAGNLFAVWQSGIGYPPFEVPGGWEAAGQDGSFFGIYAQRFTTATCAIDPGQLCLNGRFRVEVRFIDPRSNLPGAGRAVPLTSDTGGFWFFDASNAEVMIKILDGRALNGHFWVFAGALSDVEYTITVTDTQTGKSKAYPNTPGQLASRADTTAF